MGDTLWFVFLRGMNLGGRRITNDDLCAAVTACGHQDVTAYQASGNLVIRTAATRTGLQQSLEDGLESELGYPVPTFVRSADDLTGIVASNPFDEGQIAASRGKRQVVLLQKKPSAKKAGQIQGLVPAGDVVVPDGRELHWLPAAGLSDSALDLRRLDQLVGGTTIRTHGTLARMVSKFVDG